MNVILSRVVGVIAGAIVTALVTMLHLDATNPEHASFIQAVQQGVSVIAMAIFTLVYAIVHKAVSNRINPSDSASKHVTGVSAGAKGSMALPLGTPVTPETKADMRAPF